MPAKAVLALGLVEARHLDALLAEGRPSLETCARVFGWPAGMPRGAECVDRLHLGSEFCETLIPSPAQLRQARDSCERLGLGLAVTASTLSDKGVSALFRLFDLLPDGAELVVNDWGCARLARRERPDLALTAGRLLCKMIKDPRLPNEEWSRLYPHGIASGAFAAILDRLGIGRIEMDAPPFARSTDFQAGSLRVGVHAGAGFSVKGRACRTGSLGQAPEDKFKTGHNCRRECLSYVDALSRPLAGADELQAFQRGNTLFYAHSPAIMGAVTDAVGQGWVDRLILMGDWNDAGV
jgi:hypothetical protein